MTDKVQKIREEVQRLQNELIQEKEKGFGSDTDDACILELQNVLTFIDSLQEEPVSSVWHDTSENPKEEEYLICVYKDNRYHIGKIYKDEFDRLLVSDNKNIIELCMFEKWAYLDDVINLSNVERTVKDWKEEPVSEDLEEAAVEAFKQIVDSDKNNFLEIFKAGAQWQKAQEYTCYEEAFEDGAKWKKEKIIDKACKWLDENAAKYLVDRFVGSTRVVGIDISITEDFRKDVENE